MKTLQDAWPLDGGDPQRYKAAKDPKNPLYNQYYAQTLARVNSGKPVC